MCDKSCSLTEEEYKERTERLEKLFKKPIKLNDPTKSND
jgi:ATP-dependent DNA ligase